MHRHSYSFLFLVLPLRQPSLVDVEREEMDQWREEMLAGGYVSEPPPVCHPSLPESLWPRETWARLRTSGKVKGVHKDVYFVCGLCNEAALLCERARGATLTRRRECGAAKRAARAARAPSSSLLGRACR